MIYDRLYVALHLDRSFRLLHVRCVHRSQSVILCWNLHLYFSSVTTSLFSLLRTRTSRHWHFTMIFPSARNSHPSPFRTFLDDVCTKTALPSSSGVLTSSPVLGWPRKVQKETYSMFVIKYINITHNQHVTNTSMLN